MPNIHEYEDDPGYYIYARPPDAGNITYGIDELAYPIFNELGYEDGDSIPWSVIQILKEVGLDDTDGEGTTPDINDIRSSQEIDSAKIDQERFFEVLVEVAEISKEEAKTVRKILQLESVNHPENISNKWKSIKEKQLNTKMRMTLSAIDTTHLLDGKKDNQKSTAVTEVIDWDESDEDYIVIFEDVDGMDFVEYFISIESEKFIADISRQSPLAQASRAEAFSHIAIISQVFGDCGMWSEIKSPTVEIQF